MAEYQLYGMGESGNCYKVALMLTLCGCDWEPVFVDFFGGETRSGRYRADHEFLVGNRPTIADFSLVGYQYYREETGIDPAATPHLAAWTQRIAALPGWKHPYDLMPRGLQA